MFCSNCGTRNDEDDRFCAECGNRLIIDEKIVPEPAAAYDVKQNQPDVKQETKPASQSDFIGKLMSYELPENTVIKLPFPSFVLKFFRMGIWTLYFFSIFFGWVFYKVSGWGAVESDSKNLFQVIFNSESNIDGVGGSAFLVIFGLLTLLVILSVVAVQILRIFISDKLPAFFSKIPQLALCAAPAVAAFLFMIIAWIALAHVSKLGGYGISVSAGPGFGAWFVFILSSIETVAFFLFIKSKKESLFKA